MATPAWIEWYPRTTDSSDSAVCVVDDTNVLSLNLNGVNPVAVICNGDVAPCYTSTLNITDVETRKLDTATHGVLAGYGYHPADEYIVTAWDNDFGIVTNYDGSRLYGTSLASANGENRGAAFDQTNRYAIFARGNQFQIFTYYLSSVKNISTPAEISGEHIWASNGLIIWLSISGTSVKLYYTDISSGNSYNVKTVTLAYTPDTTRISVSPSNDGTKVAMMVSTSHYDSDASTTYYEIALFTYNCADPQQIESFHLRSDQDNNPGTNWAFFDDSMGVAGFTNGAGSIHRATYGDSLTIAAFGSIMQSVGVQKYSDLVVRIKNNTTGSIFAFHSDSYLGMRYWHLGFLHDYAGQLVTHGYLRVRYADDNGYTLDATDCGVVSAGSGSIYVIYRDGGDGNLPKIKKVSTSA